MRSTMLLVSRNIKLFFKDKGMFFTSLATPMILLVLYATFLGNVYRDSFLSELPGGVVLSKEVTDGFVAAQLTSSILAVSAVTVAFCSNMLMVQDKANDTVRDLTISPVKSTTLAISYYFATLASTLIVCFAATAIGLVYMVSVGFYMNLSDIFFLFLDMFLLVMFGTALSSTVNFFLSSQAQISAVGSIVSSCYGFISGAYMPISQFSDSLQKVIGFLPGTYGTSLIRNHTMNGVFDAIKSEGIPSDVVYAMRDTVDCNMYFFGNTVKVSVMYAILVGTVILLIGIYVFINILKSKRQKL